MLTHDVANFRYKPRESNRNNGIPPHAIVDSEFNVGTPGRIRAEHAIPRHEHRTNVRIGQRRICRMMHPWLLGVFDPFVGPRKWESQTRVHKKLPTAVDLNQREQQRRRTFVDESGKMITDGDPMASVAV